MIGFITELLRRAFNPIALICWFMASLVATYCGPFGTFADPLFPNRAGYWFLIIAVSIFVAHSVRIALHWTLPALSLFERELAATLLFSIAFTPMVWQITTIWFNAGNGLGVTPAAMFGFVLLIGIFVSVLVLLFELASEKGERPQPAFMASLPNSDSAEILSLRAQDHYVHVVTDTGRFRVLMRFSDAIAQLEGVDGMRVHRSYWVARTAVEGAVRRNGQHYVTLVDGSEVPVSRSYRKDAANAGLI